MPSYRIAGIDVQFPFDAYDCQLVYMEHVIRALQRGCNALLESPTGTGKTLCLLCATLAWRQSLGPPLQTDLSQDSFKPALPTIIYASRTHSQLQQVIRELKSTTYRPKMVVLGSREQMCIHNDVKLLRGRAQNQACRALCKSRSCYHQNRVADYLKAHPDLGEEPLDIEDLLNTGRTQGPCPYYLSRELHNSASIIFAPYNYLIEKENRRSLTGICWENSIFIFDEAHNLEGICADAASFDLPTSLLISCVAEAKQCVNLALVHRTRDNAVDTSTDPENFAILTALLLELEKRIYDVNIDSVELGFTRPGPYIYEFLADIKITWETVNMLIDTIDYATNLLEDEASLGSVGAQGKSKNTTVRLQALRDALRLVFRGTETSHSTWYRFHIHTTQNRDGAKGSGKAEKSPRVLSWWCFNPGIVMEEFASMGVRSIVLTSGTLAPLDSFAFELRLPFDVRLENPHVIGPDQIWIGVVSSGPSGRPLNSSYRTRDSNDYKLELGNAIVNFARIVPDGILVFFPSYYLLNQCIEAWQTLTQATSSNTSTVWARICRHKQPVVEPKESALFNHANQDFMTKMNDSTSSGAIFFAVCRGKASEGLDFADRAGRAVVVTGIPYALKTDPKVRLKREYLDEHARLKADRLKVLTGEDWYVQQASRAVNQAVGRVIRHRNDYGAIILCDERYAQGKFQNQISLWLRPHIQCYSKFGDAAFTLTRFFRDKGTSESSKRRVQTGTRGKFDENNVMENQMETVVNKNQESSAKATFMSVQGYNGYAAKVDKTRQNSGIFGQKVTTPMGLLNSNPSSSIAQWQPLSAMLAAGRQKAANNKLTSIVVTAANCAIGSADGIVYAPDGPQIDASAATFESVKAFQGTIEKNYGAPEADEVDTLQNISSQKIEAPMHLSQRSGARSDFVKGGSRLTTDFTRLDGSFKCLKNSSSPVAESGEDKKTKNAAGFLKEVKAHLSIPEYRGFLESMRELKQQSVSMSALLDNVANLFCAPERLFLLHRFGDFVPSRHRHMYEKCLAAKCAAVEELSAQALPRDSINKSSGNDGTKLNTPLCGFPSKSRKRPANAE